MRSGGVFQVVLVKIRLQIGAGFVELLMILGARERSQDVEFQKIERQFANLESVLAGLQSQQSAIGQIQTIKFPTSSK